MQKLLITATLLTLWTGLSSARNILPNQPMPAEYLEDALNMIEYNALQSQGVDWPRARAEALASIRGVKTVADTYPQIRRVLALLGDRHSQLYTKTEWETAQRGQPLGTGLRVLSPENTVAQVAPGSPADAAGIRVGDVLNAVDGQPPPPDTMGVEVLFGPEPVRLTLSTPGQAGREVTITPAPASGNSAPTVRRLASDSMNDLAVLTLPGTRGDGSVPGRGKYAELTHDMIRSTDQQPVCGWIVDLRGNPGGTLWPMVVAAGPLLGEGELGSLVSAGERLTWAYRGGAALLGGDQMAAVPQPYTLRRPLPPVAVLTSRLTATNAETLAIAFRGRPRTRSFGEPTAGAPTANRAFVLDDGAMMQLTTFREADRNGIEYSGRVAPDEAAPTDWPHLGTALDPAYRAAHAWLATQPDCHGHG